jgi:hypothetical protein
VIGIGEREKLRALRTLRIKGFRIQEAGNYGVGFRNSILNILNKNNAP